jgi:hypothetical protein
MKDRKLPENFYGIDWGKAENAILKWGDTFTFTIGGGVPPTQASKFLLIDIPNIFSTPVLFTLDLEILDLATGLLPVSPPIPNPPLWGAGFTVMYGAGNDSRRHKFPPGIHSLMGDALRVTLVPQFTVLAMLTYQFNAHCTIQEGVAPSYTWGP